MTKVLWFPVFLIKYLIVSGLLSAAVWYFFPNAAIFVLGLLALGAVGAAWDEAGTKAGAVKSERRLKRAKDELDGFDQALRATLRGLS